MSVRDKIAGFGGAGSTSTTKLSNGFASAARIGTNVPMSSSNARSFPNDSASNGDAAVRKLKVPDAFQKNTQASGAAASSASSFPRDSAASKWGAKPGDKSGGSMGAIGGATGVTGVGSAAGTGTASQSSAPVQGSPSGSTMNTRVVADANKPGSSATAIANGPSSLSSRTTASGSDSTAAASAGGSGGGGGGNDRGLASPRSRSGKPKAGPRKLNLTRISAEKQRAALCLDKKKEGSDGSGAAQQGAPAAATVSVAKPATGLGGGRGTALSSSSSYTAPTSSSSYTKPAHASSSSSQGRFNGGTTSGGGARIPSAGSLRSSGHNLW